MINSRPGSRGGAHGYFVWYELMTSEMEAAKAFYGEVVGWGTRDASPNPPYAIFTAAGLSVAGLLGVPAEAIRSGFRPAWLGYVGVADVDATAARIAQLGGTLPVPPKDMPAISRIAIAVDPQMATIGVLKWLDKADEPPIDLDALGRVGWHELFAADWEKAWDFYSKIFGWQKALADTGPAGTYQLFSIGELPIGGMFTKPAAVPVYWLYYFNVADIDDAGQRVKANRGHILEGPVEIPGNRWVIRCTDPQGATFALIGKRRHHGIGYFERAPLRRNSPSD